MIDGYRDLNDQQTIRISKNFSSKVPCEKPVSQLEVIILCSIPVITMLFVKRNTN